MLSSAKTCNSCRSRQELSNEYLLAKFGVDTAESVPLRYLQFLKIIRSTAAAAENDALSSLPDRAVSVRLTVSAPALSGAGAPGATRAREEGAAGRRLVGARSPRRRGEQPFLGRSMRWCP